MKNVEWLLGALIIMSLFLLLYIKRIDDEIFQIRKFFDGLTDKYRDGSFDIKNEIIGIERTLIDINSELTKNRILNTIQKSQKDEKK